MSEDRCGSLAKKKLDDGAMKSLPGAIIPGPRGGLTKLDAEGLDGS
jgi:hypothetical protein